MLCDFYKSQDNLIIWRCGQKVGPRKDKTCIQFKKEKKLLDYT